MSCPIEAGRDLQSLLGWGIMDGMFGNENNPGGGAGSLGVTVKDNNPSISYTKTNKLITALYMVTDIMEKDEPIKGKLRTLGAGIISDMHTTPIQALSKISEIMSFLDIAGVVNMISEMNLSILRKEFFELKTAIEEVIEVPKPQYKELSLSDLFRADYQLPSTSLMTTKKETTTKPTLGVQKGSTLMKALNSLGVSDKSVSDTNIPKTNPEFENLKKLRRDEILAIVKTSPQGVTITDIRTRANGILVTCSEKTLQRELIDMLKDGVLMKTGEKRWSRYFVRS